MKLRPYFKNMVGEEETQTIKEKLTVWMKKPGRWQKLKEELFIGCSLGLVGILIIMAIITFKANNISVAVTSLIAVVVSAATFFLRFLVDVIRRPVLAVELFFEPPDCHKVITERENGNRRWEYYFALRIYNYGSVKADHVRVKLTKLQKWNETSKAWDEEKQLTPDRLCWRLSDERDYEPTIHPETYEHCNIGFIIDPSIRVKIPGEKIPGQPDSPTQKQFHIQIRFESNNGPHLLSPGRYRLHIEASCSNGGKVLQEYELWFNGYWTESEFEMLRVHIKITPVV